MNGGMLKHLLQNTDTAKLHYIKLFIMKFLDIALKNAHAKILTAWSHIVLIDLTII